MKNLKTYLCRNCIHKGKSPIIEPCYTCSYYNLESISPVEFVYEELVNIFENNDNYDRRLKVYELLNSVLFKSDENSVSNNEVDLDCDYDITVKLPFKGKRYKVKVIGVK
jgi:hypothetical protein